MEDENIDKLVVFSVLADNINIESKQMSFGENDVIVIRVEENICAADLMNFYDIVQDVTKISNNKVLVISRGFDIESVPMSVLENWRKDIDRVLRKCSEEDKSI